ncbi:MAG: hypothetical protein HY899_08560 [Deltaproteobacteria bacterium]|nr:hypothetical protein [Deltaproteobacteria bacterium]
MIFWRRIETACFAHLGAVLACALTVASLAVIGASYWLGDRSHFFDGFFLNLGTEIFGIALTIGFVDYLLAWRKKREHILSAKPRMRELLREFQSLRVAYHHALTAATVPPADVIRLYGDTLEKAATAATRLGTLVDEQQPALGNQLAYWVRNAETQIGELDGAADAVQYVAQDAAARIDRVRADGERLLGLADEVRDQIAAVYELTPSLPQENPW